jgi:pyruvate dehydrogenase E2 component (dihydrolipoamide acetyltransferase)
MGDFLMPSLGADMDSGTVLEWRVRPGDTVHRGDIVAVVDTDKSTIDVEVFEDGVVTELVVAPGREVPVGTVLARIDPAAAATTAAPPTLETAAGTTPRRARKAAARTRTRRSAERPERAERPTHVRASPMARRLAADQGIALDDVDGSGPGGAVVASDLDRAGARPPATTPRHRRGGAAAASRPVAPTAPEASAGTSPPGGDRQASMRRAIAALMARSAREIPHYHVATTIELSSALAWLRARNDGRPPGERLLPAALLLKAAALAAREVPALNGFWTDDEFRPAAGVHLGVAVSLRGGGLVTPAIHDADQLLLDDVMAALSDLVARARAGRLRSSEVADPTITVTNLGDLGADEVHGVIHPPQVALVGFGRIAERPWAEHGMLGVRPTVRATLAADHRATDGLVGARYLAALDRKLHTPEEL